MQLILGFDPYKKGNKALGFVLLKPRYIYISCLLQLLFDRSYNVNGTEKFI